MPCTITLCCSGFRTIRGTNHIKTANKSNTEKIAYPIRCHSKYWRKSVSRTLLKSMTGRKHLKHNRFKSRIMVRGIKPIFCKNTPRRIMRNTGSITLSDNKIDCNKDTFLKSIPPHSKRLLPNSAAALYELQVYFYLHIMLLQPSP